MDLCNSVQGLDYRVYVDLLGSMDSVLARYLYKNINDCI